MLSALLFKIAEVIISHPFDEVNQLGVEVVSLLDLLVVVVVDLGQSVHVVNMLSLDSLQLA